MTAHPRPVVLVHGLLGNRSTNWQTFGPVLKNNGYCVFALTYGVQVDVTPLSLVGGLDDMRISAGELSDFVDEVLAATGASQVGIASAFRGTDIASLGDPLVPLLPDGVVPIGCTSCLQFAPDSQFMTELHEGGMLQGGVHYTSIVTKYDELVIPYTNGVMDGVDNIVLQDVCPQDLDPANAEPVTCARVLPLVGELIGPR